MKNKYNRVKEKCWKLNQENDFYNQTITVFLTIKKVLEKQVKFTNLLYHHTIKQPKDIQLDQNFGFEERLPSSRSSTKRNIFEKKSQKNEVDQTPEELKQGIQVCSDKLIQLDQKMKKLMNQLKTNQMDLLLPSSLSTEPKNSIRSVHGSVNSNNDIPKKTEFNY